MTLTDNIVDTSVTLPGDLPRQISIVGGLPPFTNEAFVLSIEKDAEPFLRLDAVGEDLSFHVLDPFLVMGDYGPEISDEDDAFLDLRGADETLVVCIANLQRGAAEATINLAAPIIVNLRTGIGRQAILRNATQFSVRHRLFPE